ncbi:hypothetical protein YN1_7780 [Nanoarchaeota archaeon]
MVKVVFYGNIASGKTTLCYELEKYNFKCNEVELDDLNILRKVKDPLKREIIFYNEFDRKEKSFPPYINSNTKITVLSFLELFRYYDKVKEFMNKINFKEYFVIYLKGDPETSYNWYLKRKREDSGFWDKEKFYELDKILYKQFNSFKYKLYDYIVIEDISLESRVNKVIKNL